jgi:hypothetical protein
MAFMLTKEHYLAEAARYRVCAARVRQRATEFASPDSRRIFLDAAETYDSLARAMESEASRL